MEERIFVLLKYVSYLMMVYGSVVLFLIGPFHFFNWFYLVLGIVLFVFCSFHEKIKRFMGIRLWHIGVFLVLIIFLFFVFTQIRIVSFAHRQTKKNADVLIILGSQYKEDGPSRDYKARLDSAYEYLVENEKTIVICTGAKGDNEPVSEAAGGALYLKERGIDAKRIFLDEESYNTLQNIENAKKMIKGDLSNTETVIVSVDYHLYRACYIAKKLGFEKVCAKGGHGLLILLPQYYTREFFGLLKEYVVLGL